jgi:hypothetical protein
LADQELSIFKLARSGGWSTAFIDASNYQTLIKNVGLVACETKKLAVELTDRKAEYDEQDADVVMFIHSEDRFKEKEERTNITKIIVAKHRNGPVGEVELYFDQKRTTFMDLDKNSAEGFNASHQAAPDPFGGAF